MTQVAGQDDAALADVVGGLELPWLGAPLVRAGAGIRCVRGESGVTVHLELGLPLSRRKAEVHERLVSHLRAAGVNDAVSLELEWAVKAQRVQGRLGPIPGVSNVVAVSSGKGGVGKSTTTVNLALALAHEGARVGVLDADIYGPNIPHMLGVAGQHPDSPDGKSITPLQAHGLQTMSIGLLVDAEQPMAWRGPMVTQALNQLLNQTAWDALDYLLVDMPPGTGDIQLTLSQRVPVSGAVVVTTPQDIALLDARKGLQMFRKVNVRVLGIVENMGTHICSNCGYEEHVFGSGGGERIARQYDVPLLGTLPLDVRIREEADGGRPTVVADPEGAIARAYREAALAMAGRLSVDEDGAGTAFPEIVMEDS